MVDVKSKIGEKNNLVDFVTHYSEYRQEYENFKFYCNNLRNIFVLFSLFIPVAIINLVPSFEGLIIVLSIVLLAFFWKPLTSFCCYLVSLVYKKISLSRWEKAETYRVYGKKIKRCVRKTVQTGSSNYIEDVVKKLKT